VGGNDTNTHRCGGRSECGAHQGEDDALPAVPASQSDIPSAAQIADKLLGRNLAGSEDGGRTVRDALRVSRNKVTVVGTTLTVYAEDDKTVAWVATIATDPSAQPLSAVDPA